MAAVHAGGGGSGPRSAPSPTGSSLRPVPSPTGSSLRPAPSPTGSSVRPVPSPTGSSARPAPGAPGEKSRLVAPRLSILMSDENMERMSRFISSPQSDLGVTVSSLSAAAKLKSRVQRRKKKRMVRSLRTRYQDEVTAVLEREEEAAKRPGLEPRKAEHKLGPRSRFGDGDGGFWDRWLVYERCVPDRSSFSSGTVKPMSGFKKRRQLAVKTQAGWDHITRSEFSVTNRDGYKEIVDRVLAQEEGQGDDDGGGGDGGAKDDFDDSSESEWGDSEEDEAFEDEQYLRQGIVLQELAQRLPAVRRGSRAGQPTSSTRSTRMMGRPTRVQARPAEVSRHSSNAPPPLALTKAQSDAAAGAAPSVEELLSSQSPRAQKIRVESKLERHNYFGSRAKRQFFDAYRELSGASATELPKGFATVSQVDLRRALSPALRPQTAPVPSASPSVSTSRASPPAGASPAASPSASPKSVSSPTGSAFGFDEAEEKGEEEEELQDKEEGDGQQQQQEAAEERERGEDSDSDEEAAAQRRAARLRQQPSTARRQFLTECHRNNLIPEPMVVRKLGSTNLKLAHYGIGDEVGGALAAGLGKLPRVQHVDLSDNRLSEATVNQALAALGDRTDLLSMDLSRNSVSTTVAPRLAELIKDTRSLQSLKLQNCKLGDRFVASLVAALVCQQTLVELDLGNNRIGNAGASHLCELLLHNWKLTTLNLQWNSIRGPGGAALMSSLHSNSSLKVLDVSHNGFADAGCYAVAEALQLNSTLIELDLGHNQITAKGAIVLLHALEGADTLKRLSLAGNAIGFEGAAVALSTTISADVTTAVDLESCNIDIRYGDAFNLGNPEGRYRLNVAEPYDLAVAKQILLLTRTRTGYALADVVHTEARGRQVRISLTRDESALTFESETVPPFIDAKTGFPLMLPDSGVLELTVQVQDRPAIRAQAVPQASMPAVQAFVEVRGHDTQESVMRKLAVACSTLFFTTEQVRAIVNLQHPDYKVRAFVGLAPRIVDSENSLALAESLLNDHELVLVRRQLGHLLTFSRLHPSGRYDLMLERHGDRQVALRLMELSNIRVIRMQVAQQRGGTADEFPVPLDTSQLGNWSSFRNARIDKKKFAGELDQRMPRVGRLRLDFVLFTAAEEEGPLVPARDMEELIASLERAAVAAQRRAAAGEIDSPRSPMLAPNTPGSGGEVLLATPASGSSKSRAHAALRASLAKDALAAPSADYKEIAKAVGEVARRHRGLLGNASFTCLQLATMASRLVRFPGAVETAVPALVSRVMDPESLPSVVVTQGLPEPVRRRLCDLLGWLNAWTPTAPNGGYVLQLGNADERAVAAMLTTLAVAEGKDECVSGQMYRPKPRAKVDKHWVLPPAWARTPAEEGALALTYRAPRDVDLNMPMSVGLGGGGGGGGGKKAGRGQQKQQKKKKGEPAVRRPPEFVVPPESTLREALHYRTRGSGRVCDPFYYVD